MLVSYCYEVHLNFFYENMAFTPTVKWAVWGKLILPSEYNYAGKSTCLQYICYARFSLPTTVVLNRVETKSVNSKFEVYLYITHILSCFYSIVYLLTAYKKFVPLETRGNSPNFQ